MVIHVRIDAWWRIDLITDMTGRGPVRRLALARSHRTACRPRMPSPCRTRQLARAGDGRRAGAGRLKHGNLGARCGGWDVWCARWLSRRHTVPSVNGRLDEATQRPTDESMNSPSPGAGSRAHAGSRSHADSRPAGRPAQAIVRPAGRRSQPPAARPTQSTRRSGRPVVRPTRGPPSAPRVICPFAAAPPGSGSRSPRTGCARARPCAGPRAWCRASRRRSRRGSTRGRSS